MTFFVLVDQCFAQPSAEKLPPALNENKHRDLQMDHVQRVRDLGLLSSKWNISLLTPFPQDSKNSAEVEV